MPIDVGTDAVVHPLSLTASTDNSSSAEVGKVAGDFGLALAQDLDKVADTDLASGQQVEKAQACGICQGREELGQ